MANRLASATSPYLQQHRHNPVAWHPWDEQALAEARASDRPILLSIGYAACHWCHVMAHESFESAAIAALMNEHFVNIKVDREERPDLDQIYQHALALLGQQGGWPLTMFLTPEGEPFWGGTYFPPEARYGRPGLPEVLETVSRIWREERHRVTSNTEALREALGRLARPAAGAPLPPDFALQTAHRLVQAFDTIHGGLAGAPKFPQAPILHFLWSQALASGDPTLRHPVLHTLRRICQGGIYDHLGGGFARYAVDAMWLVPHFEKMLYDNAQLLTLLADAWADTQEPLFHARARETVAWLEREMRVEEAFASSLDADSEGEEGKYYVWDGAEIDQVLGATAAAFRLAYGVTDHGNWEGKTVLNRLHQPGLSSLAEEEALAAARQRLLEVRETRPRPERDDKVLADWNGLMIQGLVRAAAVFDEPRWLELGKAAFAFVASRMTRGDRLVHSWRERRTLDVAFVDDYAQMSAAAVALFEHTGERGFLERAERWVEILQADFADPERGGFFQTPEGLPHLLVRTKSAADGPSPSGNATLVGVLARLHALTGKAGYRTAAEQALRAFAGEARSNPVAHATLLSGGALLDHPLQIVLIGRPGDAALAALRRIATAAAAPGRIVATLGPDAALPAGHPAAGKGMVDNRPTAYVCPGQTCRLPVTDPVDLAGLLQERDPAPPGA